MKLSQLALAALAFLSVVAAADDTELFVTEISARTGYRPQILVIFDNSGSMGSVLSVKEEYNPDTKYEATGSSHSTYQSDDEKAKDSIYWAKGDALDGAGPPAPTGPNEWRRFEFNLMNCEAARKTLLAQGYFTGYLRQYSFSGKSGSWREFPKNSGLNADYPVDCFEDIAANDPTNPGKIKSGNNLVDAPEGLPVNGLGSKGSPVFWDTTEPYNLNTEFGTGEVVTFYTGNYLRWYHNADLNQELGTKLQIAKDAINNVVSSTLVADFGLEIFNRDAKSDLTSADQHGGRIIKGIPKEAMTEEERKSLTDIVDTLKAETWTPLCEGLYEAYRYFSGGEVLFGKADVSQNPKRDTSIETGSRYIPPFRECNGNVYVILVTDGAPTFDERANEAIKAMPGMGAPFRIKEYRYQGSVVSEPYDNYLAALAEWMHNQDINQNAADGEQHATLFTIGFGDEFADKDNPATQLLTQAAHKGGGAYFAASSAVDLSNALQSALTEILNIDGSITSPAVATNAFDRTQILDNLYYAVFKPSNTARWRGNLKKLKLSGDDVVGRDNVGALSPEGGIAETAKTFWTTQASSDGPSIDQGGVVEMLTNLASRNLYFDAADALKPLTRANLDAATGSAAATALLLDVLEGDIDAHLGWLNGLDVDDDDGDGNTGENREDLFADPMHSRPVVINYGGVNEASQDLRIVVGTNGGFLHMFRDLGDTVSESWAFMPKELMPNVKTLRDNLDSPVKVYGMDATVAVYRDDLNFNGRVDNGEKVWLFAGMRRGGQSYYALDISEPDSPKLMWRISPSTAGFEDLGESWSRPNIAFLRSLGAGKPVLFFGGGYDPNNEGAEQYGVADNLGKAIFMVNAETGALIRRFSADEDAANNTLLAINHSIPGEIAPLDADGDGFIDRIYAADTGGDVWRVDLPTTDVNNWSGYKFATLGGITAGSDRRFFVRPTIARSYDTRYTVPDEDLEDARVFVSKVDTDYVVIGSGNVSHPLDTATEDKYFMLKDYNTGVRAKSDALPDTIVLGDLFDLKQQMAAANAQEEGELPTFLASLSGYKGCFIPHGNGEKVMAPGRILSGNTLYTTFTPAMDGMDEQCRPTLGQTVLYNSKLCDVTQPIYSEVVGYLPLTDAVTIIPPKRIKLVDDDNDPDTPPVEVAEDGDVGVLAPDGVKDPCPSGACEGFNRVLKHYSVQVERQ